MQHSNAISLRSIFLLGMICCMLSSLSAIDQWTTMPMQSVNTMQTGVRPIYTTTGSLRRGMLSAAPVTTMGSTSTYSPATTCYSGRSTTVLGRNAEMTLQNINVSTPVMRRLGGGDNDDDDDWGDNPGSGAGGGSSGQPEASVGTVMILLLFAEIYFAVQVRRKRKKDQAANQTINQHLETQQPNQYQQPQSQSTNKIKTSRLMKKVAAILFLLSLALSAMAASSYTITYSPGAYGTGTEQTATTGNNGKLTLLGAIFMRSGYVQTGWTYTKGNGTVVELELEQANVSFDKDRTLTPIWEEVTTTYTITYNAGANGTGYVAPDTKTGGVALTLSSSTFARAGYVQDGWSTSDGGAKAYNLGGSYTDNADITLYPHWVALTTYTITYLPGTHGTGTIEAGTKYQGIDYTLTRSTFTYDENHVQDGWSTSDGGAKVYELGGTYSTDANVTLYPHWTWAYYVRGTMFEQANWNDQWEGKMYTNGTRYAYSMTLEPGDYEFKIYTPKNSHTWYGNYGLEVYYMDYINHTDWQSYSDGGKNIGLRIGVAATYTFLFDASTNKVSVIFPDTKYYLVGEFTDNWASPIEFHGTGTTRIAEVEFPYGAATQQFKIKNNYDEWYGNNGTMTVSNHTGWVFETSLGNCRITPSCAGTYRFILNTSTMALTVEYPEGTENGYYIVGDFNNWTKSDDYLLDGANSQVSIPLAYQTTYEFYLVHSCTGVVYSVNATWTAAGEKTLTGTDTHAKVTTGYGGEYVFKLSATTPKIYIYYPTTTKYYLGISGIATAWALDDKRRFTENTNGSGVYTLGVNLEACTDYEFKIVKKDGSETWNGSDNTSIHFNCTDWTYTEGGGSNISLTSQKAGIYTFSITPATKKYSVKFPEPYCALIGDFNSWSRCSHVFPDNGVLSVSLTASSVTDIQILTSDTKRGFYAYTNLGSETPVTTTILNYDTHTKDEIGNDPGIRVEADMAGEYSFIYDFETHQISIIYPDVEHIELCRGSYYNLPYGYVWTGDNQYVSGSKFMALDEGQYVIQGDNVIDLSHVAYTFVVTSCPYEYRILSHTSYGDFYSNVVYAEGDSLSFFAEADAGAYCHYQRRLAGASDWTVTGANNLQSGKSVSSNGIYHTAFTTLSDVADMTDAWTPYEGELYVYNGNPNVVTTFEEITPNRSNANEYFDHTVVMRGTNNAATTGVTMGDEINTCISYADGRYSAQTAEGWDFVRYIYNASDNHFQRTILKYGNSNYLYVQGSTAATNDFTYLGDNKFEVDFNGNANCNIHLIAKNGTEYQYLLYRTGLSTDVLNVIGTMSSSFTMAMHAYYDFRTNKILCGWMPNNYYTSSTISIDANLLIRRIDKTDPTPFASNYTGTITMGRKTYFIQEFTSDLSSSLADSYFYFTLPYAASMSDIFGLEDMAYKTNYTVQRYRGDKRAQYGDAYVNSSPGYWANLNTSASLEAGRGYEIGIDGIAYPSDQNAPSPSKRRLIFPSSSTGFIVKAPRSYESTVIAANAVSSGIDEASHANWNVVGTPGLVAVTPYASSSFDFTGLNGNTSPNYLYTWNGNFNDFTVQNYQTFTFQPMMSYFMQYVGTIQWGSASTPAAVRARAPKSGDRVICDLYEVSLSNTYGEEEDKTYVSFSSDGANTFEQHRDLYKIPTANHAQIYSAGVISETQNKAFAAQDVERDVVVEVPLTLTLENGEYTISLTNVLTTEAIPTPLYLYDAETDTRACLTDGQVYTFQSNGKVAGRFFLRLYTSDGHNVATDLESVEENQNSVLNVKYIRNGKLYIRHDGNTYDATGLRL